MYLEIAMFKNYFKIAFRNLKKQKVYSIINITGLAIGITFFILLISYVREELTYDRFHTKADKIHMLTVGFRGPPDAVASSPILAEVLKSEYPEILQTVRLWESEQTIRYDNKIFNQNVAFTDPEFFDVFTFPLKAGNPFQVLDNPSKVVLSPEMAHKFFGDQIPLGKILSINLGNEHKDFIVSGVFEEFPHNSSIQFDFLISFQNVSQVFGEEFNDSIVKTPFFHCTFLEIMGSSKVENIEAKFSAFIDKYYGKEIREYKLDPNVVTLGLHKLTEYHLGPLPGISLEPRGRPAYSIILFGIALVVLLLACFNYMNLSIGQSTTRFKEIGTRKVIGAQRSQLIIQFLTDSLLLSFLAFFLGLMLTGILFPRFNAFTGKALSLDYLKHWHNLLIFTGLMLFVGIVSGSYPAFVLSRMRAVDIFRGESGIGSKNIFTRALILLQFSISIFLIIATMIMAHQIDFLKTKDLGFNRNNVVAIPTHAFWFGDRTGGTALEYFKNELKHHPDILAISGTAAWDENPMAMSIGAPLIQGDQQIAVSYKRVEYDFLDTLGISLLEGRNFSPDFPSDVSEAVIVNETFVKRFDLKDPVGKNFSEFATDSRPEESKYYPTIIGVVKDFHFSSLHQGIEPLALNLDQEDPMTYILVRISPQNISSSIDVLRLKWNEINPDKPFMYYFLDDVINQQYRSEQNWSRIINSSSGFAIFIACIGLFGLTALAVVRRTKEIGIRKVLGARVPGIVFLLSKEFVILICLANIIAWPLAYYAGNRWLQGFAYRTGIGLWIFVLSAVLALVIAMLTVSYKTIRAALADPVEALRYE